MKINYESCFTERNKEITKHALEGVTLKKLGETYKITPGRVHQIVAKLCRNISFSLYNKAKGECVTSSVKGLRKYKRFFIVYLMIGGNDE